MNLIKISSVNESKAGKPYAKDILGRWFTVATGIELVVGHYAYFVETEQTKGYSDVERTTLVDLAQPIKLLQITATFPSKAEAIEAVSETLTMGAEVVAAATTVAKALKLTDAQVEAMSAAW